MPTESDACKCGWVNLYHPRGPLVTLPIGVEKLDYHAMFANLTSALDAGFQFAAPGLEEGEQRFDCASMVRRSKSDDRSNSEVPVIDLYEANNEYKTLSVYLDTDDEVAAFERASRVKLTDIMLLPASAAPKRGDSKQTDRYFLDAPKPFGVVVKMNPKHDPNEKDTKKMKPKRLFVRWVDDQPAASSQQPVAASPVAADDAVLDKWQQFSQADPPLAEFNAFCRKNILEVPEPLKDAVRGIIRDHAKQAGWVWNDAQKAYMQPAHAGAR